ncbi:MAG: COX15/CtaA family protein [Gammaproteobacteria bacterium]|jgi:heme a synthase|nr:COX15/CtaA family protein [Gammaproteobacteria bacterium]
MSESRNNFYLYLVATLLTYCVIVLGAYTRLSDAGLGCPDWPGCYGKIFVPGETEVIEQANQAYPERPVEQAKAWKEMIHRYAAGSLGLIILLLALKSWYWRSKDKTVRILAPSVLLSLVIFQAALGMWTVTLLLKPVIVTAHLLGGMAILALLYWQLINSIHPLNRTKRQNISPWLVLGVIVVYCQIALGGWTSANYSALICTDFPKCQAQWWPQMDFKEGFILWRGLGVDYEGGVLDAAARTAIHVSHRLGALFTFVLLISLAVRAILSGNRKFILTGVAIVLILLTQISLGIANVLLVLPLPVAVAHNGVAALLLLSMITLLYFSLFDGAQKEQ